MTRLLALLMALTASAAFASEDASLNTGLADDARAKLVAEGYEVRKIDVEDGLIEAYALKDGKKVEIYLDSDLNVVRTKSSD